MILIVSVFNRRKPESGMAVMPFFPLAGAFIGS
jgi:hypothetical protein